MTSKPARKASSDPARQSPADGAGRAVIEQLLREVDEAIAECQQTWRREDEEAGWIDPGPDPMPIAQRKIRRFDRRRLSETGGAGHRSAT